jgi:hypothetical protein
MIVEDIYQKKELGLSQPELSDPMSPVIIHIAESSSHVRWGRDMRSIVNIIIILISMFAGICDLSSSTTLISELWVGSVEGHQSTMAQYSYLKEKPLNSRYSDITGLKTGSFNYLANGRFDFAHRMEYYDGQLDGPIPLGAEPENNSYIRNDMQVNFWGEKGISKFFSEGFFANDRGISAGKKVWYADVDGYRLGPSYMSPQFNVNAHAVMGPTRATGAKTDYEFNWESDVFDSIVNVREGMGWANIVKGPRIDWEEDTQVKGSNHIVNNLFASGLYIEAAVPEDWLPCCFGRLPIYAGQEWPNVNQEMILNCTCPGRSAEVYPYYWPSSALTPGGKYYVPGKIAYAPESQWYLPDRNYTGYYDP